MQVQDHQKRIGIWSDDFDTDLLKLLPDLREDETVAQADRLEVFCYASVGEKHDAIVLSHPTVWNSGSPSGIECPFFISPPAFGRDANGWVSIGGRVTRSPLVCVSAFDALRDLWVHNYDATLNGDRWTSPLNFNEIFYPLMYHMRGRKCEEAPRLLQKVRSWVVRSCQRAIEIFTDDPIPF